MVFVGFRSDEREILTGSRNPLGRLEEGRPFVLLNVIVNRVLSGVPLEEDLNIDSWLAKIAG